MVTRRSFMAGSLSVGLVSLSGCIEDVSRRFNRIETQDSEYIRAYSYQQVRSNQEDVDGFVRVHLFYHSNRKERDADGTEQVVSRVTLEQDTEVLGERSSDVRFPVESVDFPPGVFMFNRDFISSTDLVFYAGDSTELDRISLKPPADSLL